MKHLKHLFKMTETKLLAHLEFELGQYGYRPLTGKGYLFAVGENPVLLVAHVDTVFKRPPQAIYHDQMQGVLWSPDGLGADDRAGVLGILRLLERGYRPSILFCDGEESGLWGAKKAAKELSESIASLEINAVIELDRKGVREAVFYECGNNQIRDWVIEAGFIENIGTFSDISELGEGFNIAAVNLSCGYHRNHSREEYLVLDELEDTLSRVWWMLDHPPNERWLYEPMYWKGWLKTDWQQEETWDICDCCQEYVFPDEQRFSVGQYGVVCEVCAEWLSEELATQPEKLPQLEIYENLKRKEVN